MALSFFCDKMSMSFVATQVVGPMHGTLLCKAPPPCTTRQGNAPHWVQLHERCSQSHVCKSLSVDCQSVDLLNTLARDSSHCRPAGSFASGWIVARGVPLFRHSPVCSWETQRCFLPSCWCLTVLTAVFTAGLMVFVPIMERYSLPEIRFPDVCFTVLTFYILLEMIVCFSSYLCFRLG